MKHSHTDQGSAVAISDDCCGTGPVDQIDGSRRFARLRDYVGRGVITTSTYEARPRRSLSRSSLILHTN